MIANYHTHTWRCGHAAGEERQYVENAIQSGLQVLGFSDHAPYCYPNGYRSRIRMDVNQLEDYVRTVLSLRQEYNDRIQIHLGLEMEYYPDLIGNMLPILRDQTVEYLLLGQHYLGNEMGEVYSGRATEDKAILIRYCDQSIDAIQTGLFSYFAHPDLIHYVGDAKEYTRQVRRICKEAKNCGLPLECNILGMASGRHYPNPRFWEVAAEEGCQVILGRDAHEPEAFLDGESEKKTMEFLRQYDLNLIEKLPFRKI